jgi:hypothetical protein
VGVNQFIYRIKKVVPDNKTLVVRRHATDALAINMIF